MTTLERLIREASNMSLLSTASNHEIVYAKFITALKDIYGKDLGTYKHGTVMLDSLVLRNIEPYLKARNINYTAKGFSAIENSELPLRGLISTEGKIVNIMNYGILHISPDTDSELFLYFFGPLDRGVRSIIVTAYRNFESLAELVRDVKAYYADRIRNNRLILEDCDEEAMEEVHWYDVILPVSQYSKIRISIESFLKSKHIYERLKIPYKRGILFAGAPGNGKTMICKAIAWECNLPFILFSIAESASDYELNEAFKLAEDLAPAILCFEDLDALKKTHISMSYFLNKIDGFESLNGVLILATTNKPEDIDAALSNRPSRFDSIFRINNPDEECRFRMLKRYFEETIDDAFLEDIVSKTKEFTMAYLKELYLLSAMISVNKSTELIGEDDVSSALEILKQQILTGNKPVDDEKPSVGFRF